MAKHKSRRRRRRRKYLRGKIEQDCALGALATKALVSCVSQETVLERMLVSSVDLTWALKNLASVSTDGPVIVGLAHSDYSASEIEEVIENSGSWKEGDLVAQEIGKRKVRIVGILRGETDGKASVLNDGKPIKTRLNWILTTGKGIDFFAYNAGSDALTTGSILNIYGHANLFPQ